MTSLRSTPQAYGRGAQLFHWISAVLILTMIPLGLLMQNVESETVKLTLYRGHVVIGILILLLTLFRMMWRRTDPEPLPPAGIEGWHLRAFKLTHVFLYLGLLVLSTSGIGIILFSGIGDLLSGASNGPWPDGISTLPPRVAHGVTARIYIALLIGHIGGVLFYQFTKSDVMSRMGWRTRKTTNETTSIPH